MMEAVLNEFNIPTSVPVTPCSGRLSTLPVDKSYRPKPTTSSLIRACLSPANIQWEDKLYAPPTFLSLDVFAGVTIEFTAGNWYFLLDQGLGLFFCAGVKSPHSDLTVQVTGWLARPTDVYNESHPVFVPKDLIVHCKFTRDAKFLKPLRLCGLDIVIPKWLGRFIVDRRYK